MINHKRHSMKQQPVEKMAEDTPNKGNQNGRNCASLYLFYKLDNNDINHNQFRRRKTNNMDTRLSGVRTRGLLRYSEEFQLSAMNGVLLLLLP